MMGGALGLAVLASIAAKRSGGATSPSALTSGYHLAFLVGAAFAIGAVVLGVTLMRSGGAGAPHPATHGEEAQPASAA